MIGNRRKIRSIARRLESEGVLGERPERVHMPIGQDVGAIAPEEIPVAIFAEMIHCRRRGREHPLSKKPYETAQS